MTSLIKSKHKFSLIILFFFFQWISLYSQNFNNLNIDPSKINVDQLSDEQIQKIVQKAQESGMSQQEIEAAALAKGVPPTEIKKLEDRIAKLNLNKNNNQTNNQAIGTIDRTRQNNIQEQPGTNVMNQPIEQPDSFEIAVKKKEEKLQEFEKRIFGYDLFNNKDLTFEPSLNIPTPQNYQIGPGDEIVIDVWGASQLNYKLTVSPEGSIFVDNVGPIYINGLTINKASDKITGRLSSIYSGLTGTKPNTFAQVSLGNLRSIKVTIAGDIRLPGTYTLSSLATVFNALYASGGPSMNGSFRSIQIFRENKLIDSLDVYDFLIRGNQAHNIRLQDQDLILVNPYKTRVEINGEVKRQAFYEIKEKEHLNDLIGFAGGFSDKAYSYRLKIIRNSGREYRIFDIDKKDFSLFSLENGDSITVGKILNKFENKVDIEGAVYRSGQFELSKGLTLKQLIDKAEGIRGDAFMPRAIIYRLRPDLTKEAVPINLNALLNNQDSDKLLQKNDSVKVFSIFELQEEFKIDIYGEIIKPGTYPFVNNLTLEDLIAMAGGLKESASLAKIEVARRIKQSDINTKTAKIADIFQFTVSRDLKLSDSTSKFILEPFDNVFVRKSPEYEKQTLVIIKGEVLYPGSYSISNKDERISDLITRSGGLTPEAYPKGARLVRKLTENIKERKKVIESIESQSADSLAIFIPSERKEAIGIDMEEIIKNPHSKYDITLQDGDSLLIPKELQTVRLSGAFLYPITVRYDKSYKFSDYASKAGGFAEDARPTKAYVVYANGSVDRTSRFMFFDLYPKIEPGAEIIIPKKVENKNKLTLPETMAVASGMSSLAVMIITIRNLIVNK